MADEIDLLVAYAEPERQWLWPLRLPTGSTLQQAIEAAPWHRDRPQLQVDPQRIGVFGRLQPLSYTLRAGDRVELYRALLIDPKDARRRRAQGG